jgi:cysteinyl-tRNA synthetase
MYVCGPTPYDVPHLGHGRTAVVFDTIRRYLAWSGYRVVYVSNVTDVEDKIIARAQREGTSEPELAQRYEDEYWRQMDRLNVLRPDEMPRATEFIAQMQALIAELIASGRAYVVEGQGVYFEVGSFAEYGKLSRRSLGELLESAGARVEVDERKRSPVDFALWKAAKPGEPQWDSPWGPGRPGWHIECSAMSLEILGDDFDLHGGGSDLEFPHAEGAGHRFARHWIHSGMVNVDGEKMSKSVGNFTTLEDVLDRYDPRAFRLLVLQTHYRRPMEVGEKELADAEKAVERVDTLMRRARRDELAAGDAGDTSAFRAAMDDDFDTPAALAGVFEMVRDANAALDDGRVDDAARLVGTVRELWSALGLWWLDDDEELDDEIATLVARRDEARERKDWSEADRLRDELKARGILLEDTPTGTVWRRLRPDDAPAP